MDLKKLKKLGRKYQALITSPIEGLQKNINQVCGYLVATGKPVLYVSLNKPYETVKAVLEKQGIATKKIFFIDCLAEPSGKALFPQNVIRIESPADLTSLEIAISEFLEKIKGEKSVLIDALATLLIYNSEELTIKFTKSVLEKSQDSRTVIFTPSAKGTGFIEKIAVFFDEAIKLES